jgi:hypothetical protein
MKEQLLLFLIAVLFLVDVKTNSDLKYNNDDNEWIPDDKFDRDDGNDILNEKVDLNGDGIPDMKDDDVDNDGNKLNNDKNSKGNKIKHLVKSIKIRFNYELQKHKAYEAKLIALNDNLENVIDQQNQAYEAKLIALNKHLDKVVEQMVLSKPDPRFLGHFKRDPSIRSDIDHIAFQVFHIMGGDYLCWFYENNCHICYFDKNKPNTVYVRHTVEPVGNCISEFTIDANEVNITEWNLLKQESWNWIRYK